MQAFISYRHTGEDSTMLKPLLSGVCDALAASGMSTYCSYFDQADFDRESLKAHEIMQRVFTTINSSDFLLVILTSENKSEGMLMEVGYCIAKKIPVIVAVKEGVVNTYLPDMADYVITWRDGDELNNELRAANFAELVT